MKSARRWRVYQNVISKNALGRLRAVLCAGLLATGVAWAGDGASPAVSTGDSRELSAIVKRLQGHYQSTDSFKAKFKEEIVTAGGVKRDREGTIAYCKPGRMRWDFTPPQQETIVSDGTTLFVYEPDLNQVVETPLASAFRSSAPAALLLGMGDIERDFFAAFGPAPPADRRVHLALKPKADGARVALILDPRSYDIVALTVTDELGNVTALDFSDIRTNVPLDEALFSFKVPDGVDVVTAPGAR